MKLNAGVLQGKKSIQLSLCAVPAWKIQFNALCQRPAENPVCILSTSYIHNFVLFHRGLPGIVP